MKLQFKIISLLFLVFMVCACSRDNDKVTTAVEDESPASVESSTASTVDPSAKSSEESAQGAVKTAATTQPLRKIILMTHDSFSISAEVIALFEKTHHAEVVFLKSGDAGEALNKAILSKNNPLADVFYGVDNTFLSRALAADIFIPHESFHLADVDPLLILDDSHRLLPVDFGDVCINYDRDWFKTHDVPPPVMLEDLIAPRYKGMLVVENPATSSPGLAFLLTTISRFGDPGYLDFWKQLKDNDVRITSGWKEAYWGKFSAASDGNRPLVVSYASSPAAEVYYAEDKPTQSPTGVVIDHGSAFRQIEFAGILRGTKETALAAALMDFLLSPVFQADIPLQMFVFPSNQKAALPAVFQNHAKITSTPATLSAERIRENREKWLSSWTELML